MANVVDRQERDEKRDYYEEQSFVTSLAGSGSLMSFNVEHGYLEAIVRGFRSGFLREFEYRQLCQCESLEDFKLCFGDTDFASCLQNIEGRLTTEIVVDRLWDKFVEEFDYIRSQAVGSLATFLNYIQYEYMITNISFLIVSLIKKGKPEVLVSKCDPMGTFPRMKSILTFENSEDGLHDLYRTVLVDTPIAPYFEEFFAADRGSVDRPFDEMQRVYNEREISIIANTIKKLWLEDFYAYCMSLGGITAQVMGELLSFEADRRAISIMINSFDTPLNDPFRRSERRELFCSFGSLYPEGIDKFDEVNDMIQLGAVLSKYGDIDRLWRRAEQDGKDVEDVLYEYEVHINRLAFEQQSHFACFWAYTKLKEQEKRNVFWIAECISQQMKDPATINRWIKIF